MPGGFKNKPKILRGAFVEYGLSLPPLMVVFQFNPVELTRSHGLNFTVPNQNAAPQPSGSADESPENQLRQALQRCTSVGRTSLRDRHRNKNLLEIREDQQVTVQEETIGFQIRLDATDKLNEGDLIAQQFGISPQLATLEAMVYPKSESLLGELLPELSSNGFSYTSSDKPPIILFIWGRKRVLPVNIHSMNITETEFSTDLNPIRATVSVSLTVIEGSKGPHKYSQAMREAMAVLNLANITEIADVIIPG